MVFENMNIKDEEVIFIILVKENDLEVNIDIIYDWFVYFDNLLEDGF